MAKPRDKEAAKPEYGLGGLYIRLLETQPLANKSAFWNTLFEIRRRSGRPREDSRAEEAHRLHEEGYSWPKIAILQSKKYGIETNGEAVRKLVSARKARNPA